MKDIIIKNINNIKGYSRSDKELLLLTTVFLIIPSCCFWIYGFVTSIIHMLTTPIL